MSFAAFLFLLLLLYNDSDMNGKDIQSKIYIGDTVSCCSLFVLPIACQSRVLVAAVTVMNVLLFN